MIRQNEIQTRLQTVDMQEEQSVRTALKEIGLYSGSYNFPLASLQFELTAHCNDRCKHCYNNSGVSNIPDAMTPEEWISFSRYLVEHGGIFECILSGGEPLLLGDKLFEIMDILHEDGTYFMLLTNGSYLNKWNVSKLQKYHYHWLQVSIDGVDKQYHDWFRERNGSWIEAVSGAKLVAQYGIPLKIAHCVTPYNITDIDDMCALAFSIGASSITIGELCLSGRTADNQELLLSQEQRRVLFDSIERNRQRYHRRMIIKSSNGIRQGLERHSKKPYSCAIVRPNGDVRLDGMAPFVIGNLFKTEFAEIWKRAESAWLNPKVVHFMSQFNDSDRNSDFINYIDDDIRLY